MSPAPAPSFPPLMGYIPREHIASGGQSSVWRALNLSTDHHAAMKVVPLRISATSSDAQTAAKAKQLVREMRIHETLQHRNILRLFGGETREDCTVRAENGGETTWPSGLYMLLDLADGGDLFDKITPDVGVDNDIAHLYFRQLIAGLKYLNGHGICHRDVKPENCLLDGHGNLKISDFGLATVFKYKGQERLLKDRCGSPPYAAPELARAQPYAAEPIDVWSAGVVLFALLFGNTPWDEPTSNSPEFSAFLSGEIFAHDPWRRLGSARSSAVAQMLLAMLTVNPEKRPRLKDVERMDWYLQPNPLLNSATGLVADSNVLITRLLATLHAHEYIGPPADEFSEVVSASQQPSASGMNAMLSQKMSQRGLDPTQGFTSSLQLYVRSTSRQLALVEPLVVGFAARQSGCSSRSSLLSVADAHSHAQSKLSMAPTQRTNPNLTRFFTTQPLPVLTSLLSRALQSLDLPSPSSSSKPYELLYPSSTSAPSPEEIASASLGTLFCRFRIRTTDKRRQKLFFGITIAKSVLPSDDMNGMEIDGGGQEGFDVVCLKKEADPLEMKRVWRKIVERMPEGVIVAT